jgi:hypothetical protein
MQAARPRIGRVQLRRRGTRAFIFAALIFVAILTTFVTGRGISIICWPS